MSCCDVRTLACCAGNVCSLQSIGLGGNDIHDEGASHLANALKTNTRLRSLGLGGNQIGEHCRQHVTHHVTHHVTRLLCVCVCVCSVAADEGGKEVAEMLKFNHTVRKLLLSSNLLGM